MKPTTPLLKNPIQPSPAQGAFVFIAPAIALACFGLSLAPKAFGVSPAPDGGYPNDNTAEGTNALFSLTTGYGNTANGYQALFSDTTGSLNTANGWGALGSNTDGFSNVATGFQALFSNTTGNDNTAHGYNALFTNTVGSQNTAIGWGALFYNRTASGNTATGYEALFYNTGFSNTATGSGALFYNRIGSTNTATGASALELNRTGSANTATGNYALELNDIGDNNTATGSGALGFNISGSNNTATGYLALYGCGGGPDCSGATGNNNTATGFNALISNTTGNRNTAEGFRALFHNTTGSNNIALGSNAGINLTTGSNNIDIGAAGIAGESDTIRIGKMGVQKSAFMQGISGVTVASGITVIIDAHGQLGTIQSSARFKEAIKPMDKVSETILALKPVTFHYKKQLDPEGIPQFGLVAEEVEKVNPDLVVRDSGGKVNSVRYEAVNAMLLNEFLKEHGKVEEQDRKIRAQEATITELRNHVGTILARLKEQDSKIQKVSDQLELNNPAFQVFVNNP
jgi:trimeric autotransporter adhesin